MINKMLIPEAFAKFGSGILNGNGHKRHKNAKRAERSETTKACGLCAIQKIGFVTFVLFVVNPHFSPIRTRI